MSLLMRGIVEAAEGENEEGIRGKAGQFESRRKGARSEFLRYDMRTLARFIF